MALAPKLGQAQKDVEKGREELISLKKQLKAGTKELEKQLEDAEAALALEKKKYGLRLPDEDTNVLKVHSSPKSGEDSKRRRITIERSAAAAYGGNLHMYLNKETRLRTVWFLRIMGEPYMEWADLKADSATRMQIAEVNVDSAGLPPEEANRFFSVKSVKKNKVVGFLAPTVQSRVEWLRVIRNGLGLKDEEDEKEA